MLRDLTLIAAAVGSAGWPSLYTDCSTFPELGQAQKRPNTHPSMALLCEPTPPTSFEWCMEHCVLQGARQNCSHTMCTCTEHCMAPNDVCVGSGADPMPSHTSLVDALAARPGNAQLLLDGQPATQYVAGETYRLTILPGAPAAGKAAAPTWFLVDAGVGELSMLPGGPSASGWKSQCSGTRASMRSAAPKVEMFWSAPASGPDAGAVALRVAVATSMGNLSISAAILNSTSVAPPPRGQPGYFCTSSKGYSGANDTSQTPFATKQCQAMPLGTPGTKSRAACDAECFHGSGPFACARCGHVYDAAHEGNGTAFEDLPDSWVCPVCGAPKSSYLKRLTSEGRWSGSAAGRWRLVEWVHEDLV